MEEIISVVLDTITNKYADFEGRASRKEYWYFVLASFIVSAVLGVFGQIRFIGWIFTIAGSLVGLAILIPGIAVGIRRMHDIGKSGWFLLINLIPAVGWIIFLVFCCQESQSGTNEYGPNPLGL